MIDYYGTLENFPHFLEKCEIDISCFTIQLFIYHFSIYLKEALGNILRFSLRLNFIYHVKRDPPECTNTERQNA